MTVTFFITTFGDAGGHYYSLMALATEMSKHHNVQVINIGYFASSVLKNITLPYRFIFFNGINVKEASRKIAEVVCCGDNMILHCYDYVSYALLLSNNITSKYPILLTKCGGVPISVNRLPRLKNLILFSQEDLDYYKKVLPKYCKIRFIPNRVAAFASDRERIQKLICKHHLQGKRVILKIGRISTYYEKTILQAINLSQSLHELDDRYELLLVGSIQQESSYNNLISRIEKLSYIHVENDEEFTHNAKEIIDIADIVIGTGRGFMEACYLNKLMFAPCANFEMPVFVNSQNFKSVFRTNFSERYLCDVKTLVPLSVFYSKYATSISESRKWFDEFFDIRTAVTKVEEFYKEIEGESTKCSLLEKIRNRWILFRSYDKIHTKIIKCLKI